MLTGEATAWGGVILATAVGVAGAALSPVVVARRWAFATEGVAHAGFAGAGVVWAVAGWLGGDVAAGGVGVAVFAACLVAGVCIAALTRRGGEVGVATGAVLTVGLAVGFLGREVFVRQRGAAPVGFETLTLGAFETATTLEAAAAVACAVAVLVSLGLLRRPVTAFVLDPRLARSGGLPERGLHYGLMLLVALTVAMAVRVVGALLVTTLLVLPGAAAARLCRRPATAVLASAGLGGGVCLLVTTATGPAGLALPTGPVIVLVMFAAYLLSLTRR